MTEAEKFWKLKQILEVRGLLRMDLFQLCTKRIFQVRFGTGDSAEKQKLLTGLFQLRERA